MKCKICGRNSENEYCFQHKPRKALKKVSKLKSTKSSTKKEDIGLMREFLTSLWRIKIHTCENCGRGLGNEPLSYMFDHLLEKSKYPELKCEEANIILVCLECHDLKTRGFLSDKYRERIEKVKETFGV